MNVDVVLKKRTVFLILTVIALTAIVIASSQAFLKGDFNKNAYKIEKDGLSIIYESGDDFVKSKSEPMSIQDGLSKAQVNTVKIENTTKRTVEYELKIEEIVQAETLSTDKIYYSINGTSAQLLSETQNGVIYQGSLQEYKSDTFDVRVWIGTDLITNQDQGKSIKLRFNVDKTI